MPTINETPYSRFATEMHNEIIRPLEARLVARKLATIDPKIKGDGITAFETFSVGDLSDAIITLQLPDGTGPSDALTSSAEILKIPVLHKQFQVQKSEYLAWERRQVAPGTANAIDSEAAHAATTQVARKEEEVIINGWSPAGNEKIPGFWSVANNSVTGGSIATVGTLFGYVADAMGKLNEDDVTGDNEAYNLVLSPAIHAKLRSNVYTNTGIREYKEVQELLNGGQILVSNLLSGNNSGNDGAIVTPVDASREHFSLVNPVDYRVEFANPKYSSLSPIEGVVYSLMRPYFKRTNAQGKTNAVCKITGLTI